MTIEPCDPHKQAHDQIPVTQTIQQESFYKEHTIAGFFFFCNGDSCFTPSV